MEVNEFNSLLLYTLSENLLSEKNKEIALLGNFNIDLLKYEKDLFKADFLDQIYWTSLVPHIPTPTRINSHIDNIFSTNISKNAMSGINSRIDNIFSTNISKNAMSGNIATSISDYLTQFLFLPIDQFKTRMIIRTFINLTLKILINKYYLKTFQTWTGTTSLILKKAQLINCFNDWNAPRHLCTNKKLTKVELKLKSKPWLTKVIMTSIKKKNIINIKFTKAKKLGEKYFI